MILIYFRFHTYFKSVFIFINDDLPRVLLNLFSCLLFILAPAGNEGCWEKACFESPVLMLAWFCDWSELRCRISVRTDSRHRLSFSPCLDVAYRFIIAANLVYSLLSSSGLASRGDYWLVHGCPWISN